MTDFIIVVILLMIVGAAVFYIRKSKKSGAKCIGCPEGCSCASKGNEMTKCNCGCSSDE